MAIADLVTELMRDRLGRPLEVRELDGESLVMPGPRDRTFQDFLRRTVREYRPLPAPNADTWFRVSSLGYLCPREEILAGLLAKERTRKIEVDELLNYTVGSGWHFSMQNEVLGPRGVLLGKWECWACHKVHGEDRDPIFRPDKCAQCGSDRFLYEEIFLQNEEQRINGHPDGILQIGRKRRILELKGVNENWWKTKVDVTPQVEHVVQVNMYMWLTGLREAWIVYWNKNGYGLRGMRVYEVDYDKDIVNGTLATLAAIRRGLKKGELPPRLCACDRRSSPTAKECEMADACFAQNGQVLVQ